MWIYATDENYLSVSIENLLSGNITLFWYFNGERI
ncbi:hypothetical protein ABOONEI_2904 [Aciduliprofundum boonei T469]|nr:hypothetical protein ABOONEI_2904 [Aciduliprofundum boonei T469]